MIVTAFQTNHPYDLPPPPKYEPATPPLLFHMATSLCIYIPISSSPVYLFTNRRVEKVIGPQ